MDPTNRGRYHTQGLSSSIKDKREQRKRIGVRSARAVFSWELVILSSSNPHPPTTLLQGRQSRGLHLSLEERVRDYAIERRDSERKE